jgi:hypothetical protein
VAHGGLPNYRFPRWQRQLDLLVTKLEISVLTRAPGPQMALCGQRESIVERGLLHSRRPFEFDDIIVQSELCGRHYGACDRR